MESLADFTGGGLFNSNSSKHCRKTVKYTKLMSSHDEGLYGKSTVNASLCFTVDLFYFTIYIYCICTYSDFILPVLKTKISFSCTWCLFCHPSLCLSLSVSFAPFQLPLQPGKFGQFLPNLTQNILRRRIIINFDQMKKCTRRDNCKVVKIR